ncbi:hypothetical protein V6N13_110683 [Hibiscus sabdariffa]
MPVHGAIVGRSKNLATGSEGSDSIVGSLNEDGFATKVVPLPAVSVTRLIESCETINSRRVSPEGTFSSGMAPYVAQSPEQAATS